MMERQGFQNESFRNQTFKKRLLTMRLLKVIFNQTMIAITGKLVIKCQILIIGVITESSRHQMTKKLETLTLIVHSIITPLVNVQVPVCLTKSSNLQIKRREGLTRKFKMEMMEKI